MRYHHIASFTDSIDWATARQTVAPELLRSETTKEQERGLRSVLDHSLRVSNQRRLWRHDHNGLEYNATSLLDSDGERLVIVSRYVPGFFHDHCQYVDLCPARHVPAHLRPTLPWDMGLPAIDPAAPIKMGHPRHIADAHPERFGRLSVDQARQRLSPALREAAQRLARGETAAPAYWYLETNAPCWVLPLELDRMTGCTVAGVVTSDYVLITALTLHQAYWNVLSVGLRPPTWLDGPGILGEAA